MNNPGKDRPNIVLPTVRPDLFRSFLPAWSKAFQGCHLIIIHDTQTTNMTFLPPDKELGFTYELHDWDTIEKDLGSKAWIIPRRTSAIRSYGFYRAWKNEASFIVTLDDDTLPERDDHIIQFWNQLQRKDLTEYRFYSTLKRYTPRGTLTQSGQTVGLVHGGWLQNLDLSARDQLQHTTTYQAATKEEFNEGVVPYGTFFSMCGMNIAFLPRLAPFAYFGLQGSMKRGDVIEKLPIDRCDDIWAGFNMKKACDKEGLVVLTGEPYVIHDRASNPWTNLIKEKNAEEWTEKYLNMLMYDAPKFGAYWELLDEAEQTWKSLFK